MRFSSAAKRVAIIGAGPAGLTSIKQFCDEGHHVVCFDANSSVGGTWYKGSGKRMGGNVYEQAHLTTDNKLTCFSDDQPEGPVQFWKHDQYQTYLENYAAKFDLMKYIKLNHVITSASKAGNGWTVVAKDMVKNDELTEHFDILILCTGANVEKRIPEYRGLDSFKGEILHSSDYENNNMFQGKRVLIVGCGESSADICRDISDVSAKAVLSIRTYPLLDPRLPDNVHSTSTFTTRCHHASSFVLNAGKAMPHWCDSSLILCVLLLLTCMEWFYEMFMFYIFGRDRRFLYGKPSTDMFGQPLCKEKEYNDLDTVWSPEADSLMQTWAYLGGNAGIPGPAFLTKNVRFVPNIINGKLGVNAAGIKHFDGSAVHFNDGSQAEKLDYVMFCSGYHVSFPFVSMEDFQFNGDVRTLWKHSVYTKDPTVACIGFARPASGGVPICAEMTARVLARVYNGKCKLPLDLQEVTEKEAQCERYRLRHSGLNSLVPSNTNFLDDCAKMIGCEVNTWALWHDPRLLYHIWTRGLSPAQYRLLGPHSNYKVARKACLETHRGWSAFEVFCFTCDCSTSSFFPKLSALNNYYNRTPKVDIDRWSFGGQPRYPLAALEVFYKRE